MKTEHYHLGTVTLADLSREPKVASCGCIMLCESGACTIKVDFAQVELRASEAITLFPTDIVQVVGGDADFKATVFSYGEDILREASMRMEESVYSSLREDRVCRVPDIVEHVIRPMFTILGHFYGIGQCGVMGSIVVTQLKCFFLGFYDFMQRNPDRMPMPCESQRTNELFAHFMHELEHHCHESRDVRYYADRLFITRKYLGMVVRRKTGKTPKQLVDEYVVMRIKLALRDTNDSVRQIAMAFHFSDDSLLIRYFRSHTGMTPMQFRKRL